jgi:anti-sigma factor ChrR (cupin superfamily)
MLINAKFPLRAIVTPEQYRWVASPQVGVERVMLDRIGEEQARATSIVRYAPKSSFPPHHHPGGEEILVLSGTFSAGVEHNPAGWYLRNPPGSSHQPSSEEGALLFVKLGQMSPSETRPVRINTRDASSWKKQNGREICPLFSDATEQVWLQRLAPAEVLFADRVGGIELLVLSGGLVAGDESYESGSWIRLPAGDSLEIAASRQGATLYVKTGHLAAIQEGA